MNLFTHQSLRPREQNYGCRGWGGGLGEGILRELKVDMYILLYLKWRANKVLLFSAWNSVQCYVAAQRREEFGGEQINVYIWLNPPAVHLKLSQHC